MIENSTPLQLSHDLGRFIDLAALQAQYPTGRPGDYARLTSTETIWNYTGSAWVDTFVDAATFVDSHIVFQNTDPVTLQSPSSGKVLCGTFGGLLWSKDENGAVQHYPASDNLLASPSLYLDGINDYIEIPLFDTNGGDMSCILHLPEGLGNIPGDSTYAIIDRETAGSVSNTDWAFWKHNGVYKFYFYDGTTSGTISINYTPGTSIIGFSISGTTFEYFENGLLKQSEVLTGELAPVSAKGFYIGTYNKVSTFSRMSITAVLYFNRSLSVDKMLRYSLNPDAIDYEDLGASNDKKVNNGSFDADVSWNKQSGWSIGGGIASFNGDSGYSLYQSIPVTPGKNVIIGFDVLNYVSGGVRTNFNGKHGTTRSANGIRYFDIFKFDGGNSSLYIQSVGTSEFSIDNIFVIQIGEIAAYLAPGIGHNCWKSKTGSFAQNQGPTPYNLPAIHREQQYVSTTSSSPSITPPAGYIIESISIKTKADLTNIAIQQAGSLDNLVSGKTLNGSGSEKSKTYSMLGDHEIFNGSTTLNFTLTGNDAVGTIITITYKREE
jgi:hypothetical protein